MFLVSKNVNNHWNINKLSRITPDHVIQYNVYIEMLSYCFLHIQCNFKK
jgi:hypothetical protein